METIVQSRIDRVTVFRSGALIRRVAELPAGVAAVRVEEFVNAFEYGDPLPNQNEKVACCLEQSVHPFLQQRNLLRVSMRTAAAGRSSSTPLRLTLLLDNSGSMERPEIAPPTLRFSVDADPDDIKFER